MAQPASGTAVLLGLRRELDFAVPDTTQTRVFHKPDPPLAAMLVRTEAASPEINASGFVERGIPGPITGPVDIAVMLTAATILEPLESISGALTKTTLETGVYSYEAEPVSAGVDTSFDILLTMAPVDRMRLFGYKPSSITIPIGNNNPIPARMAGFVSYGTHLSEATQSSGTGTYTMGPDVRGLLYRMREGEQVFAKATRDVAGGGVQVKWERVPSGGATATYPSAAVDVAYDSDGNGTWFNVVGAYQLTGTVTVSAAGTAVTGTDTDFLNEVRAGQYLTIGAENLMVESVTDADTLTLATAHTAGATDARAYILNADFGYWDENRDTLDAIFPGDATDHGDIDINDIWHFDSSWSDPAATYIEAQRFTSAHWFLDWRRAGATAWNSFQVLSGTFVIAKPVTPSQGSGSRYYFGLDRDGLFAPTLALVRKLLDRDFLTLAESGERFELRLRWDGQKLGTGAYREGITVEAPSVGIISRTAPIAGPAAIQETLNLRFEASSDGDAPMVLTAITDRNYTVAT